MDTLFISFDSHFHPMSSIFELTLKATILKQMIQSRLIVEPMLLNIFVKLSGIFMPLKK